MKKKTTGLLCLAAGLLVGAGVAAPAAAMLAKPSQGLTQAASSYDISVEEVPGIAVTVPSKAEAGSVVDVTVAITSDDIAAIDDLFIDGMKASQIGDGQYRFVMPSHAVNLTVGYDLAADLAHTHAIGRTVGYGLNLINLPESAEAGEYIDFAITFDKRAGYTFNGFLDIYTLDDSGEKKASLEYEQEGSFYFFEMPDEEVFVEVGTEKRSFTITKSWDNAPSDNILSAFGEISLVEEGEQGEEVLTTVIAGGVGALRGRAEFGSRIRVPLHNVPSALVKGLLIVETGESIMLEEGAEYVEFTVPGCNVTLQAIFDIRYYEVDLVHSLHISLEVYHQVKDEEGNYSYVLDENDTPKVQYNETAYVKAVSVDPDFGAMKVLWSASGDVVGNRELQLNKDGFYEFTSYGEFESQSLMVMEAEAFDVDAGLTVNFEENTHLSLLPLVQDGGNLVTIDEQHKAFPNNKLFLNVESTDHNIGLKKIVFQYTLKNDLGGTSEIKTGEVSKNELGMSYIIIPVNVDSITLTVYEQPYFDSYGFTGQYVGKYISTYSSYMSDRTAFTEITPWGTSLITNYSALGVSSVSPAAPGASYGTFNYRTTSSGIPSSGGKYRAPDNQDSFTATTEYIASYSSKFVVYTDTARQAGDGVISPIRANETNTIVIGARKFGDTAPAISFETLVDNSGDTWYLVTAKSEDELGALLINKTKGELFNNDQISITFTSGSSIADQNVSYSVKNGDELMFDVGKSDGVATLLDGLQGTYSDGNEGSLVLDGMGNVIYGDVEAKYSKNADGTISFTYFVDGGEQITKTDYVVALDKDNMTALVESSSSTLDRGEANITFSDVYPFTYNAEDGTYTSGNYHVASSNSYMYIECDKAGILSFDFETEGEGGYDYATIVKGTTELFSSKTSGTGSNHAAGHMEIEVEAGDIITIQYHKDSSGDVGDDNIVISNLNYFVYPESGAGE